MKALTIKKVTMLRVMCLFVGLTVFPAFGQSTNGTNQTFRDQFVGAWRLLWLEEEGADGKVHRADCTGLLVYTADGHMSVQVMYRNPKPATQAGPVQYAQGGYEASFGTCNIDERAHSFTFHVEGALVRSLVGKDLTRSLELSGKQLILKAANPNERWRVAWEHD